MPDRAGRPTFNDFYGLAQGLRTVQAMGNQQTAFNQQQEDRAAAVQYEDDVNRNLSILHSGPTTARPYEVDGAYVSPSKLQRPTAMVGTPRAQVEARGLFAKNLEFQEAIKNSKDRAAITELADSFIGKQSLDLSADQKQRYSPAVVAQAQVLAARATKESSEAADTIMSARQGRIKKEYANLLESRALINAADQRGDKAAVAAMVKDLSEKASFPYRYEFNPDTGNFAELYRHSGSDRWQANGQEVPYADVLNKINTVTPKQYAMEAYRFIEGTTQWNELARMPAGSANGNGRGQYFKKKGKEFYVFPQKPSIGTSEVHYVAMDEDNNETIYKSMAALQRAGFRYRDLKREESVKDLEYKDQQITTSKALQGKYNAEAAGAGDKAALERRSKLTKQYKADLAFVLTPFVKPGTDLSSMFSEDGSLSSEGKGALQSAMNFVQDNPNPTKLNPLDQMKWQRGRDAIHLYNGMTEKIVSGYRQKGRGVTGKPGPNDPPVKGARRAKDGFWYVQKAGQWHRVHTGNGGSNNGGVPTELKPSHGGPHTTMGHGRGDGSQPAGGGGQPTQSSALEGQPTIRPELPQDISQWNVQTIPQGMRRVPVVMTDRGPVPITDEELEMYKAYSSGQPNPAIDWFKKNATGVQKLPNYQGSSIWEKNPS